MDDALLVRGLETFGDLEKEGDRLVDGNRPAGDPVGQVQPRIRLGAPIPRLGPRDTRARELFFDFGEEEIRTLPGGMVESEN